MFCRNLEAMLLNYVFGSKYWLSFNTWMGFGVSYFGDVFHVVVSNWYHQLAVTWHSYILLLLGHNSFRVWAIVDWNPILHIDIQTATEKTNDAKQMKYLCVRSKASVSNSLFGLPIFETKSTEIIGRQACCYEGDFFVNGLQCGLYHLTTNLVGVCHQKLWRPL